MVDSQYSTIIIDTAMMEFNPITFNYELKFSGILQIDSFCSQMGNPLNDIDEDTALILVRELITQVKILSSLTSEGVYK
jgi:hypothetical protein